LSRSNVGFSIGGPKADCGLSGRKVIADTYGGVARHGGGGLSGKDPSKIDRCGMYAARYIAKNLVAAGLADRCEVQLAYMIGHSEPIAISAECIGGHGIRQELIIEIIRRVFPLSPPAIVDELRLRRPIYRHVGLYGHFGHEGSDFTWEECDRVADIHRFI
jgi:S-adenosylmethionine synthetase